MTRFERGMVAAMVLAWLDLVPARLRAQAHPDTTDVFAQNVGGQSSYQGFMLFTGLTYRFQY